MVSVVVGHRATSIVLVGHGLNIPERFKLAPGIYVQPSVPVFDEMAAAQGCETRQELFAVLSMQDIATFSIEVYLKNDTDELAAKAWNALWMFHLLSIASGSPAFPLFTYSEGVEFVEFGISNRNLTINPVDKAKLVTLGQLKWARTRRARFDLLVKDARFGVAMRYFGNAHYLHDLDSRVMLLWAGIEAILDVDAEQSRRVALYCAIMLDGHAAAKVQYFETVKRAYGSRSRIIHGKRLPRAAQGEAYSTASAILGGLLAKAVDLGRVPDRNELDTAAASAKLR